ncbi:MAG: succinylglutamate desuccinylase/aspartoacylase family protein [Oscillospiraceae bacterium]|nr:succinylglutamate desuccinylase/aspartoacylase family protein [Oscillospiraceae bacterium]MBR0450685.1 succinylglutamate desuccinylase/aspartoacylase family protein [Oscillospiraceae bacterium]
MLKICGKVLESGSKLKCSLGPEGYPMPVTLVSGKNPGKTLLITAQIHSGEYAGTPAVIRLANEVDPDMLDGNLVLFHLVNITGFYEGMNAYVPEDHGNLNGCYPGNTDTVSGRIASFFVNEVFPFVDAVIDLHGGGMNERLSPCLFYPGANDDVRKKSIEIADATDIPVFIMSRSTTGEVGYAGNILGIPSLLLERGYGGMYEKEWGDKYYRDLRLILDNLGMYHTDMVTACEKRDFTEAIYMESADNGLWYPAVELNQVVHSGDYMGKVEDLYGNILSKYYAQADGEVMYYRTSMNAVKGHNLVSYVLY